MRGPDPEFEAFLGLEEVHAWLGTIPREKTRRTYGRALFQYWRGYLPGIGRIRFVACLGAHLIAYTSWIKHVQWRMQTCHDLALF